jgi:hypothetical protein
MKIIARTHPFLVLGGFVLAMMIIGQFWQTPFYNDAEGLPRLFCSVWHVVFLPVQALMGLAYELGGPFLAVLALAAYFGAFIGLDRLLTRIAGKEQA